jgi:hypothetical protein
MSVKFRYDVLTIENQLASVEYSRYLGNMMTNDARCAHEIKSRTVAAKQHSTRSSFTSNLDLNLRRESVK